jgi:hypothetical protein
MTVDLLQIYTAPCIMFWMTLTWCLGRSRAHTVGGGGGGAGE